MGVVSLMVHDDDDDGVQDQKERMRGESWV